MSPRFISARLFLEGGLFRESLLLVNRLNPCRLVGQCEHLNRGSLGDRMPHLRRRLPSPASCLASGDAVLPLRWPPLPPARPRMHGGVPDQQCWSPLWSTSDFPYTDDARWSRRWLKEYWTRCHSGVAQLGLPGDAG
eukprot:SM000158S02007  [mRNA]  locus=s158:11604:13084:+ [translate_table: standard]